MSHQIRKCYYIINDDHGDHDDRLKNHVSCRHDARFSSHDLHDDDDVPRDRVPHDVHDDPRHDVPYHDGPFYYDDPHDDRNDDVPPSCDVRPHRGDVRDDRHASRDDHLCDNHHRTYVPCETHLYGLYDDNRESFRPSCGPFHDQILIPYDHVHAHDDYHVHHARRDDPFYDHHAHDDDPHGVPCRDGRVHPRHDDDDPCDLYGPLHHFLRDDENDAHGLLRAHDDDHGDDDDDDDGYQPFLNLLFSFANPMPMI